MRERERRKEKGKGEEMEKQRERLYRCIAYSQLIRYISKWIHTLIGS